MNAPTPEQAQQFARERALQLAEDDSAAIAQLLDSPGWAYFSRRLRERRQQIRDAIADTDDMTDARTRELRTTAKEISAILALPLQDRAAHAAMLASARQQQSGPARG